MLVYFYVMDYQNLKRKIPDIFEKVKRDVDRFINRHRAGLSLGLVEMGFAKRGFIGGMYFSGGTMILMNSSALRVLLVKREITDAIILAYVYHILLHEYVHSLGYLNERTCRQITLYITKEVIQNENLPDNHPTLMMANLGIGVYFPEIIYAPPGFKLKGNLEIERVENFDKGSTTYYS